MDPLTVLEAGHHPQATGIEPADGTCNVPRSRVQRQTIPVSNSGLLSPRFGRPLYFGENEFSGGPDITIDDGKGKSRPVDEGDYDRRPIPASESRRSEDESSVHKVKDLGFEAAAANFSALFHTPSGCDSVMSSPLEALFEERRFRRSSRSRDPLESGCILSDLQNKVEGSMAWSQLDKEEFLPLDSFETILDAKAIALLLDETYNFATSEELKKKFESIVNPISGRSRRRTLGILVLMSQVAHIEHFIREDIWDDDLPLERSAGSVMGCVRTRNSENDKLMENWSRIDINSFCSFQKMFFVPFFDIQEHRLCSYELESNIRLPWKKYEHKTNGGFGVVHKVEIHPSHHNFTGSNSSVKPVFALKAIEAGDHKAYRDELAALEKTCAQVQREKHLIKLLLTFRHGDKFYLLFEWADGNLGEFWETHRTRPPTLLDERWAAKQCLGLARAVSRIHGLTTWQKNGRSSSFGSLNDAERDWGRHGDIKPENILWFQEYETDHDLLVISDLGLTRYHSQSSKSLVPRSRIDGCSYAYRPPELDIEERISQKYDIWSLGCVFLEFVVWYLQGYDEVESFSLQREDEDLVIYEGVKIDKFFNIAKSEDGQRKPQVKQAVKDRLRELKDLSTETTFARELLDVIGDKMLRCTPDRREKIDVICTDLSKILDSILKANNPEDFTRLSPDHSRDLAYIRRDDSAPSLRAPANISLFEEARESAADDHDLIMGDDSDPGLLMRTRSRKSRREDVEQSKVHKDLAPSTLEKSVSKIPAEIVTTAVTRKETKDQFLQVVSQPEHTEASREDAAGIDILSRSLPTTEPNNKKHRISQKLKKWFREPLVKLKRMLKG
ncbi:kinase-like protein [Alternaria alternata]|uniref:Kinase-like protein n=1 Tax=Alternaria alternata TaxID=5599 RepID=A0A177D279_ALTAL|nr:kinase-like protein [Alternaria alternata]OAG13367.1 kinase-like protein [Alternaria alternata]RYN48172.1 hypothetical protein AA0118_g11943 [Alternaria tenuissima]